MEEELRFQTRVLIAKIQIKWLPLEAIFFLVPLLTTIVNSNKVYSNIKLRLLSTACFKNTFHVTLNHLVRYSKVVNFSHLLFYDNL